MMKLQETFKYLYCKIPLVDPPPITRVLLFAEFIWVGKKPQKVISFGDVCKYDWCLHKLFKTPLLRNVNKVEVSKVFTITISMVLLEAKSTTSISQLCARWFPIICRNPSLTVLAMSPAGNKIMCENTSINGSCNGFHFSSWREFRISKLSPTSRKCGHES